VLAAVSAPATKILKRIGAFMAKRPATAKKPAPSAKKPVAASKPTKAPAAKVAASSKPPAAKPAAKVAVKPAAKTVPAKTPASKPAASKLAAAKAPVAKTEAAKPAAAAPKPATAAVKPDPKASKTAPKATAAPKVEKPAAASKPSAAAKPAAPAKPAAAAKPAAPAKPAPEAKPEPDAEPAADASAAANGGKPVRKGITIVSPKPVKKAKPKLSADAVLSHVGRLLDPKGPARKPLIPSGPSATTPSTLGMADPDAKFKTPFNKKELDRYRQILLRKRGELVGDVADLEQQALQGASGSLSHTPQHMAEQGSEAYDQALQLDLAAADRKLIREIDDALKRIEAGSYGVCELTGNPIKQERLEELPWARYSIEAARELERRSHRL